MDFLGDAEGAHAQNIFAPPCKSAVNKYHQATDENYNRMSTAKGPKQTVVETTVLASSRYFSTLPKQKCENLPLKAKTRFQMVIISKNRHTLFNNKVATQLFKPHWAGFLRVTGRGGWTAVT